MSEDVPPRSTSSNADGTGQRNLTRDQAVDGFPAWSPDGRQITYVSHRDGNSEIYVMNADGTGQRNLTRNADSFPAPAWSPDGQKIAFGNDRDVYVMNADGSGQRNLTRNAPWAWLPAWVARRAADRIPRRLLLSREALRHERRRQWAAAPE